MCDMIVSAINNDELNFIVYNIVLAEPRGRFTIDGVYNRLMAHKIKTEISYLINLFAKWEDDGTIYDNSGEYIINIDEIEETIFY